MSNLGSVHPDQTPQTPPPAPSAVSSDAGEQVRIPTMSDMHALSDDLDQIDQTLAELDAEPGA